MTLTPAKESSQEEDGEVEDEVTLVEDKDGQVKSLKKSKLLLRGKKPSWPVEVHFLDDDLYFVQKVMTIL